METMSEGLGYEPSVAEVQEAEDEVQAAEKDYQTAMMLPRPVVPDLSGMRTRAEGAVSEYHKASETARLAHSAIPPGLARSSLQPKTKQQFAGVPLLPWPHLMAPKSTLLLNGQQTIEIGRSGKLPKTSVHEHNLERIEGFDAMACSEHN
jgi:hypothetical protein